MSVVINYCEQGTPEWFQVRLGIPTASEFGTIMAKGRGGGVSEGRRTYMHKLAGERITGEVMDNYTNANMARGQMMEAEARDFYQLITEERLERVGFIRNGDVGGSPDALIGKKGMLEIKTMFAHLLIKAHIEDVTPSQFVAQIQGNLWVAERDWCDLIIYWPRVPPFIKRIYRDQRYIDRLAEQLELFNDELTLTVNFLRSLTPKLRAA